MHVQFIRRSSGPERLLCEAEVTFDDDHSGPLAGLRLVGFSLWRGTDGEVYVTFPSRAFGAGTERRYFDYLRGETEAVKRFKAFVVDQYRQQGVASVPAEAAAAEPPPRKRAR